MPVLPAPGNTVFPYNPFISLLVFLSLSLSLHSPPPSCFFFCFNNMIPCSGMLLSQGTIDYIAKPLVSVK